MEENRHIGEEISGKILDIFKEYQITYNEAFDILNHLRGEIGRTVISANSLQSD